MRPRVVRWFVENGLAAWLVPDYFFLVGASTLVACALTLRWVRRDRVPVDPQIRAIVAAYVAALAGGYLVEALRMLPAAIALRSVRPLLSAGRAAYGGLLCAILAVAVQLSRDRQPLGAFFDRAAIGTGLVFAVVRTGCFLAGCDYGVPTALAIGVRFPPGSLTANDHVRRGWIVSGAASLPVHPTQLYEALAALIAASLAWGVLRRGIRDGRAFLLWLSCYAIGRFAIEFLRGDRERGIYGGLSSAQYVSLAVLAAAATLHLLGSRARATS